ncbi:hypothetical protein HBI56_115970 [Parastagonospora nodorum]|nr:hypothetical protein HBH53_038790 [Parastagonospora nodorum]KAH3976160.1 hypothetical protein HBH52_119860 [Parastagonospora nodorum]KAH3984627.1 hypothetical protein HBH51_028930 [Parastagonospora nodorum]KAH4068171.1 hypothetical protein HBH50_123540 [Parastagonospora nodorum]KAH4085593.1 hypothetical protein HBH48_151610 [Parastagonospora nodorum]
MHIPTGTRTPAHADTWPAWTSKKKGGYDENWSSLIGIITAIVGNVLISFALNMQRYAHIRLDREWQAKERQRKKRSINGSRLLEDDATKASTAASELDPLIAQRPELRSEDSSSSSEGGEEEAYKQKSYLKSPYWWAGIILMTVGEAGNFLAYGFAPASIVSPLGVVALISNCIIAPFMLKEPFRMRDALGVVIAVGGAVTVVLSASDNNPKLGPGEIWKLISTWEFETYLGITVGLMAVLMVASNRYGDKNILIDLGLVGLFGGYTALSTKGVASLLSYTLWRVITFPVFYLLLAILIGTAVMQIKYVNRALQHFDATQVIPVQFVLFTLSVILGSAVLYRDFERTSGDDAGKFVGGCAMTFLGVWFITTGRPRRNDDDDEDREPESEDAINLVAEPYRDGIDTTGETTRRSSTVLDPSRPVSSYDSRPSTPQITTKSISSDALSALYPIPDNPTNPWAQSTPLDLSRAPPFDRHTSTPILPSEAAPPPASISDPELVPPRTPTRGKSSTEVPTTPTTTPQLRRLRTNERLARNSMAGGPLLASPLSTTLSAMVQDLKRSGSVRRESVLGIGASDDLGGPLDRRRTGPDDEDVPIPIRRGRSLSGTLGELWTRGASYVQGKSSREGLRDEERGDGE